MLNAKWKRMPAGVLGLLAAFAGALAIIYAISGFEDFWNPAVPLRLAIVGELCMCSMAFGALAIAIRLVRFSISGRSDKGSSWMRTALLSIGCFFPGFIFSIPLTMLWAEHKWPGDGQSALAAAEASVYIGMAAASTCLVFLLWKRGARRNGTVTVPENRISPR